MSESLEINRLRSQIAALGRKLDTPMPAAERDALAVAQARADSVEAKFGTTALPPVPGETSIQYRKRMLAHFQKHSPAYRNMRAEMVDATMLDAVESQVYADAAAHATDPANYKPGELRAIQERDAAGRLVTKWVGDWHAAFGAFCSGGQVGKINDPRDR